MNHSASKWKQPRKNNSKLNKIMSIKIRLNSITYFQTTIPIIFICNFRGSQSANLDNQLYIFCGQSPNLYTGKPVLSGPQTASLLKGHQLESQSFLPTFTIKLVVIKDYDNAFDAI